MQETYIVLKYRRTNGKYVRRTQRFLGMGYQLVVVDL